MRIISGRFRSRRLEAPPGVDKTRPLPDRTRVALFNMLSGHLEGQSVFDAFAGTGSFGLEAVSRGAAHCVFVERDRDVLAVLRRNVEALGVGDQCEVFLGDALGAGALSRVPRPVHVIMFDPPYSMIQDHASRARTMDQFARLVALLDDTGFAILRTAWPLVERVPRPDRPEVIDRVPIDLRIPGAIGPETHAYGSSALHWYMKQQG